MCLFVDEPALYNMYQGTTWRTRSTRSYDGQKREVLGDFDDISEVISVRPGRRVATHQPVAVPV